MANGAELYSVKRGNGFRPFHAYPAFPAIVAVWFAALFAVGSLVFPADLIGRLLRSGGITLLNPAAASSFGFTARATIAIAAALAGTALGLSLARRVARTERAETEGRSSVPIASRCRPIDVAEDLGEEGIAATEFADLWCEEAPLDPAPAAADQPPNKTEELKQPDAQPSLDSLGLMQLTARLGASLNERRTRLTVKEETASRPAPTYRLDSGAFEATDAGEAVRAIADFFAPVTGNEAGANGETCLPADSAVPRVVPAVSRPSAQTLAEPPLPRSRRDRPAAAQNLRATLATLGKESGSA